MNIRFNNFLNEEMSMLSNNKVRDAIHDIVVKMDKKDAMDIEELSNILLIEHKITINPHFIDIILDDFLKIKKGLSVPDSLFKRQDSRWLGVKEQNGDKELRNNLYYLKPNLAKHKEMLIYQISLDKLEKAYKEGMVDLNFEEYIIKRTFVLQHPDDSKNMMIDIYKATVVSKKYQNNYENCWKMMMILGNRNKLDKIRGYMKFSPPSVGKEYGRTGKINLDLKKTTELKKTF